MLGESMRSFSVGGRLSGENRVDSGGCAIAVLGSPASSSDHAEEIFEGLVM